MSSIQISFPTSDVPDALASRVCSRQWQGFFHALAAEFTEALSPQDLHALMVRVGQRFAVDHALPPCDTLDALQRAMGQVWDRIEWGSVHLAQQADRLEIRHHLAPLAAAFGSDQASWAGGFLEGVYQTWFAAAGAGTLRVAPVAPADAWGNLHLTLSS